jgi:hypothetical protein
MRLLLNYLKACLLIVALPLLASGCATTDTLAFPPAADLRPTAKPRLDPARITSEAYLDQFDIELEGWGQSAHNAQSRLCQFFKDKGMRIDCTPLPAPPVE